MRAHFLSAILVCGIAACGPAEPSDTETSASVSEAATNRYDIDPATGQVTAEHTNEAGITTRLEAGERLPVALPEPFVLFPGAAVTHNTRVEQADARLVYLDFESRAPIAEVARFYRHAARAAGIAPHVDITGDGRQTIAGENAALRLTFSLALRKEGELTRGQLVVGKGF